MLREHPYHRRVDKRPGPDIPSRVEIGLRGVAAMVADKYRLAFSVGFLAVPTGRTGAAGVAWVYEQDRNPCQRSLIADIEQVLRGKKSFTLRCMLDGIKELQGRVVT